MRVVEFETLTPLWTGGVGRSSAEARETGIIGGLRWWYEGLIRGLEGWACDPTEGGCKLPGGTDTRKVADHICAACRLFGCTGWRRRFRLEVDGLGAVPLYFFASKPVYVAAGNWLWRMFGGADTGGRKTGQGSNVEFQFGVNALWGQTARLSFVLSEPEEEASWPQLAFLLDMVSRWGALGAKPQHGFGQIRVIRGLEQSDVQKGAEEVRRAAALSKRPKSDDGYFRIDGKRFFSRVYAIPNADTYKQSGRVIGAPGAGAQVGRFVPCAFDVRYKSRSRNPFTHQGENFGMRPWIRDHLGESAATICFGNSRAESDDERSAGRIGVSHLYRVPPGGTYQLKVWGDVTGDLDRRAVEREIETFLRNQKMFPAASLQREFDYAREVTH